MQGSFFESDDELGFDDWYGTARASRGTCRGEAEGVLGTEAWNPVAWAIDTSSGTMDVDESFRKVDRNPLAESGADSSGTKPGYWDTTDGSYKLYTAPAGLGSGERSFAPTDEATWPKHPLPYHSSVKPLVAAEGEGWKPMSAAKLRAAAKADVLKKNKLTK